MFLISFYENSLSGTVELTVLKDKNIVKKRLQEKFKHCLYYDNLILEFFTSVGSVTVCYIKNEEDLERVLNLVDNVEPYTTGDESLDKKWLLDRSSWENAPIISNFKS